MVDPEAFTKPFRFHPAAWREDQLEAAAGVLMDVAESAAREHPTWSERAGIYAHAVSVWIARVAQPGTRRVVASLSLGTGIGLAAMLLFSALLGEAAHTARAASAATATGAWLATASLVVGALIPTMWLAAAAMFTYTSDRGVRGLLRAIPITSVVLLGAKAALPAVDLASSVTLALLSAFAIAALAGPWRSSYVWRTAVMVGTLGAVYAAWPMITSTALPYTDSHLWLAAGPWILLGLACWFIALATCALFGARAFAVGGVAYTLPWAGAVLTSYMRDGQTLQTLSVLALMWISCACAVTLLAWGIDRRRSYAR